MRQAWEWVRRNAFGGSYGASDLESLMTYRFPGERTVVRKSTELNDAAAIAEFPSDSIVAACWVHPTCYPLDRGPRSNRSFPLVELIVAATRPIAAIARRVRKRYRQRREASAMYNALRQLDDHTLRDLGFTRDEIASVAAEATGEAECTRLRTVMMMYGPRN